MDSVILFIFVVFVIFLVITLWYFSEDTDKKAIHDYLTNQGLTTDEIRWDWFDNDRDTRTFTVIYQTPSGQSFETRCKIRHGWSDNGLYWLDPIPNFNQQALDKEGNKVSTNDPIQIEAQTQIEPQIQGESPARAEQIIRKQNELIKQQKEVIQQLLEQNQELGKEIERLKTGKP